jgi:hypothetical protein
MRITTSHSEGMANGEMSLLVYMYENVRCTS